MAEQLGAGFVNRLMLVQIQSSALSIVDGSLRIADWGLVSIQSAFRNLNSAIASPVSVPDRMSASEAVGPGSIPGRATETEKYFASVPDSTADFETARRGSTPRARA